MNGLAPELVSQITLKSNALQGEQLVETKGKMQNNIWSVLFFS